MFTGIIQGMGILKSIVEKKHFRTHSVQMPANLIHALETGASVAHNGCCLTVTAVNDNQASFDLIQETLRVTNLGSLQIGDRVNLERPVRFGDEIGGHNMSGHIMTIAIVKDITVSPGQQTIWFTLPPTLIKYVFTKGYIGIDGVSLTVSEVIADSFCVHLIPETLARTTLSERQPGEHVNIEFDPQTQVIVDTVERVLAKQLSNGK